jgi:hypothetical protein
MWPLLEQLNVREFISACRKKNNSTRAVHPNERTVVSMSKRIRKTLFEKVAKHLGLTEEQFATSPELKAWAMRNRNSFHITEHLLNAWHLQAKDEMYDDRMPRLGKASVASDRRT